MSRMRVFIVVLFLLGSVLPVMAQDVPDPIVVDDFETEALYYEHDEYGNSIGYVPWGDNAGNVQLSLSNVIGASGETTALFMSYNITQFGGYSHVYSDGTTRTPQDWSNHNAISFWFAGDNTGGNVEFQIFDNLGSNSTGDTAERWVYTVIDDSSDWRLIEIPFQDFNRAGWQPDGAPNDGLNLDAVTGYAVALPANTGEKTAYIDDIHVITMDLPESDAPQNTAPAVDPLLVDDFEQDELVMIQDEAGNAIGYVPWGDTAENVRLRLSSVFRDSGESTALFMRFDIAEFGGYSHVFNDGTNRTPQDWSQHNAISFWFAGSNTGGTVEFQIFDNLNPALDGDTAERWVYTFADNSFDWRLIEVPFQNFQRLEWQPDGAPNDGLNLDAVTGYAIALPAGTGAESAYIDDIHAISMVIPEASDEDLITSIDIDESITWESREWELMWSDEFELGAGEPLNDEYWTCREGGWGWGNNETQYYTCRTENVAHDGDGNLVITARQESLEDAECWYGTCTHTSARIVTQDKVEFTYGRVEARIRIPEGDGMWPAFWMLGAEFPETAWPASGEIDIMENVGSEPFTVHGTIHGPGYSGDAGIGNDYILDERVTDDFHIFAIDWDPYVIRWYVDGELFGIVSVNNLVENRWVYNQDFFILMNVAVGGNWPGYPSPETVFPQEMVIDYVRVYQLGD